MPCRVVVFNGGRSLRWRPFHFRACSRSCAASVAKHSIQNSEEKGAAGPSGISPDAPYIVDHVRSRASLLGLLRNQNQIEIRSDFAGAELRGRLEQAADRADARRHPFHGRRARAEDDEVGAHSALVEGQQASILHDQRAVGGFQDQARVPRRLEMGSALPRGHGRLLAGEQQSHRRLPTGKACRKSTPAETRHIVEGQHMAVAGGDEQVAVLA